MKRLELLKFLASKDPKYSPRLYNWLRRRHMPEVEVYQVVGSDALYVGFKDLDSLRGQGMMSILTNTRSSGYAYYPIDSPPTVLLPGFWADYIARGRCAIDPAHKVYFMDQRWEYNDDRTERKCMWCGLPQALHVKTEMVQQITKTWMNK